MSFLNSFLDGAVNWAAHGLADWPWWALVIYTLAVTHITIAGVTVFLHRSQAHRALDLGPIPFHFFRFWMWLTTGQVTREWVAVHRKHHAKCETEEDPHSPQTRGLRKVLFEGAELYRQESRNPETLAKYGSGTPTDWIERNLYTRFNFYGVVVLLLLNVTLFGAAGLTIWAVQMLWIPVNAAGIINGIGHYWGYRNFEAQDASRNISPWGILIGGEELHNNHHTYPTSAKLSVKPYEFDLGWFYIRVLQAVGQAKVKKLPPKVAFGMAVSEPTEKTLQGLIAHRYEMMAEYAGQLRLAATEELKRLRREGASAMEVADMKLIKRWAHRDFEHVPAHLRKKLQELLAQRPQLAQWVKMREDLRQVWTRTNVSTAQLVQELQTWCRQAEASGIDNLRQFALRVRAVQAIA